MTCDERKNLLPLYLLGGLEPAEEAALRAHLASGCSVCAGNLAETQAALAALPLALDPAEPAEHARLELLRRITVSPQESRSLAEPFAVQRRGRDRWLWPLAAAACVAVTCIVMALWRNQSINDERLAADERVKQALAQSDANAAPLREQLARLERELNLSRAQSVELRNVVAQRDAMLRAMSAPKMQLVSVKGTELQPEATGRMIQNDADKSWHIVAIGLKPLPPGKTYELWLISGNEKVAAGTAAVSPGGMLAMTASPSRAVSPDTFALTDEPMGGVEAPTGQVQLVGTIQ